MSGLRGLFGQTTGYKDRETSFGDKLRSLGHKIADSRCDISKYVIGLVIVSILLFIIKRYWFKINAKSPVMSDLAITFAVVAATLALKAGVAIGLNLFPPLQLACPTDEEKFARRNWLPPPPPSASKNPDLAVAYNTYKDKLQEHDEKVRIEKATKKKRFGLF